MSAKTGKKGSVHQSVRTCQRQGMVGIVRVRQHARASQRVKVMVELKVLALPQFLLYDICWNIEG
jgi:hypothetical protein